MERRGFKFSTTYLKTMSIEANKNPNLKKITTSINTDNHNIDIINIVIVTMMLTKKQKQPSTLGSLPLI